MLLIFITAGVIYAQPTPPSGYTPNYKFRLWGQNARPSADSLNQNWLDIDNVIKSVENKVKTDTTYIAYVNKSNTFARTQTFDTLTTNYLSVNRYIKYGIEEITFDVNPGNVNLTLNTPLIKVVFLNPTDEAKVLSMDLMGKTPPEGMEVTLVKTSYEGVLYFRHDHPTATKTKFYFPWEQEFTINALGGMATFISVKIGDNTYWMLKSKNQ